MPATLAMNHSVAPAPAPQKRNLLVAPPSIARHEEKLHDLFRTYDRSVTDLQMLDRLSAGFVSLPPATYDLVLVLTDTDGAQRAEALRLLDRAVYNVLVPSMAPGGSLKLQDGKLEAAHASEAVLAGLVQKDDGYEKPEYEAVSVPLKLGQKKKKQPLQNGLGVKKPTGDDELIDEEELLSEEDFTRPVQLPNGCSPTIAKKRRKACKDCSCGLSSQLDADDNSRKAEANKKLNILKLQPDELDDETDFTVQGKTGSCGSCSLGDAFRCEGCPYVGLPPFKPGEEVKIINELVQL